VWVTNDHFGGHGRRGTNSHFKDREQKKARPRVVLRKIFLSFFKGRMRGSLDQHRRKMSYLLIQFGLRSSVGYSVPYTGTWWETKDTLKTFHWFVHIKIQEPLPTLKEGSILYEHATSEKSNSMKKFYCKELSSASTKYAIHTRDQNNISQTSVNTNPFQKISAPPLNN